MLLLSDELSDKLLQPIDTSRRSNALSIAVPLPFSQIIDFLTLQYSASFKLLTASFQAKEQVESVQVGAYAPTTRGISTSF